MSIECKNCETTFDGKFCSECGQSAAVERLRNRHFFEDIANHVFNFEKGLIFTFTGLTLRPAQVLNDYLRGKRTIYYHPLKYLLLCVSIGVFLVLYFKLAEQQYQDIFDRKDQDLVFSVIVKFSRQVMEYLTVVQVFYLPFAALASRWVFRSAELYFAEHLALNAYLIGHIALLSMISVLFHLFLPLEYARPAMIIISAISFLWQGSVYASFFQASWWKGIWATALGYILYNMAGMLVVTIIVALIYFGWIQW